MDDRRSKSISRISVATALKGETSLPAVLALFTGGGVLPAGTLALQRDRAGGFCGRGRYGLCRGCAFHWVSIFKMVLWFISILRLRSRQPAFRRSKLRLYGCLPAPLEHSCCHCCNGACGRTEITTARGVAV